MLDKVPKSADSADLVSALRQACQIYIEEKQADQIETMIVMPWKRFEAPVDVTELTQLKENLSKVRRDMDADQKLLEAALNALQSRIDRVGGSRKTKPPRFSATGAQYRGTACCCLLFEIQASKFNE